MNLELTTSYDELLAAQLPEMRPRKVKQPAPASVLSKKSASAYPQLTSSEMSEISLFGELTCFAPGECMVETGESHFNSFVILSGEVRVVDSTVSEAAVFTRYGTGCFTGDVDLLTGLCSVITVEAETDVLAFRLTPAKLREVFVRRPVLGDKIWRAFRHRRALLMKSSSAA